MKAFIIIATGRTVFGELALNLCLSIKCNEPQSKVMLIHTPSAIVGNEERIEKYFDFVRMYVPGEHGDLKGLNSPAAQAHYLKMKAFEDAHFWKITEAIILDADTMILPGKKPSEWFKEPAMPYINNIYDYETKKFKFTKKDDAFWCDPEEAKEYFKISGQTMPQINASFIHFKVNDENKNVFDVALEVWQDTGFEDYTSFRGSKTEELCFNIAYAKLGVVFNQVPYRPVYMQCYSTTISESYILHQFRALTLASNIKHDPIVVELYNNLSDYYRDHFGIKQRFHFTQDLKHLEEFKEKPLSIRPIQQRTLYRRGELINSHAGIFNPSAVINEAGDTFVIYRKEAGLSKNIYIGTSSIPHLEINGKGRELEFVPDIGNKRFEDYRLFFWDNNLHCSHTVCHNINTTNIEAKCGISLVGNKWLTFLGVPNLPIKTNVVEKNWLFFGEGKKLYCIYSLQPYVLFVTEDLKTWTLVNTEQKKIRWMHRGFLSGSTNPIMVKGNYLVFFHTQRNKEYYHGALLIDPTTKNIIHYTAAHLDIQTNNEGMSPKIKYVSGCVYFEKEDMIRLYIGEGDSHSVFNDFNATDLINAIKQKKC